MNPEPEGLSCVIPVHNEAAAVAETVAGVRKALGASGRPFEVILVDDGSTDGSMETARAGGEFVALRHRTNRGYGAAIKTGCRAARHPWILIIDADGSYPPEEIAKLLRPLDADATLDMVVGARTQSRETDGFLRLQGKAILRALSNFVAGRKIPDINSGLRLMRKADVERYRPLLPEGFSLTTSITLALLCSGAEVAYEPIEYRRRKGRSKIRPVRDMVGFTTLILRTVTYFNPLKVYLPLSIALIMAANLTVVVSKLETGIVMDVTSLFLYIAGFQTLMIGVIADLVLKAAGMRGR